MGAGGHIGISVFLNISETVAPRAKQMKIWARRVKVTHDILSLCITNNMKVHPRWPLVAMLDFQFFSITQKRLLVLRNGAKFGPSGHRTLDI